MIFETKDELLYPSNSRQMEVWLRRWKISDEQLARAIIECGSIHTKVLREHLIQQGVLFSFRKLFRLK